LVTELITAGSIREYIKQIRLPRLIVIKNWCYKILQGLEFLHKNELVHGKLTCESIYINSNNGDIKIGDLGIRQIPLFNSK
jgi:WNK lysine deficient protein kinase|tara:strand:- start:1317 stop:1559 length:243 start_codon:yes stop_codon:yes gene_type:complete